MKAAHCFACHGDSGISKNSSFPTLAGRDFSYLEAQLLAFKSGERKSEIMSAMASSLSDKDVVDVAAYFSSVSINEVSPKTANLEKQQLPMGEVDPTALCQAGTMKFGQKSHAIKRLAKDEYKRTLWDLLGADVANSLPALAGVISSIPNDDMTGGFANVDWSLSENHVAGYLGVANEIGVQLADDFKLRKQVLSCSKRQNSETDATCIEQFIGDFATRAYRRQLKENEKSSLFEFWQQADEKDSNRAFSSLVSRILMSPHFLFRRETGLNIEYDNCAKAVIDENFNSVTRLSYGLWGTMPDQELFAAAMDQDFLFSENLDNQISRMLDDPKTKEWINRFFRQWLHFEELPVEGYSWGFIEEIDRAHLHKSAADELDNFIHQIVWNQTKGFYDLMTSRIVQTDAPAIRKIYGLPENAISYSELVPENRAGILTRAIKLMNGVDLASPVKRGKFIRQQILCEPLGLPDTRLLPEGALIPPKPDYRLSTRQSWEAKTKPALCQSCHHLMNPLGFVLETYDGLGRYRLNEQISVPETNPEAIREHKIDTVAILNINSASESPVNNAVELSEALGSSTKANQCFVKQLATYVNSRPLITEELEIVRNLATEMMENDGSIYSVLRDYMRHVALSGVTYQNSIVGLQSQ